MTVWSDPLRNATQSQKMSILVTWTRHAARLPQCRKLVLTELVLRVRALWHESLEGMIS